MTMQTLLTPANAKNWKRFVADYLIEMTKKASNRALVDGWQVRDTGTAYQLFYGRMRMYAPMDASTLYSACQRIPLKYFVDQADNHRFDLLVDP